MRPNVGPGLLAVLFGAALALACASSEERAETARTEIRQTLAHGDRAQALEAIDDLRHALPETPDALLEVSRLLVQGAVAYLERATTLDEESGQPRAVHYYPLGLAYRPPQQPVSGRGLLQGARRWGSRACGP